MSDLPTYRGAAKAIHVPEDGFSVVPVGPERSEATYQGVTPAIVPNVNSPAQWQDATITGPEYERTVYRGRSEAIHVFGVDVEEWPPVEPIPSCDCVEEGGEPAVLCEGAMFDDFNDRTPGYTVWEGWPDPEEGDPYFLGQTPGGPTWLVTSAVPHDGKPGIVLTLTDGKWVDVWMPSTSMLPPTLELGVGGSVALLAKDFEVSCKLHFGSSIGPATVGFHAGPTNVIRGYGDEGPYYWQYYAGISNYPGGEGTRLWVEGPGGYSEVLTPWSLNSWGIFKWECKPSGFYAKVSFTVGDSEWSTEVVLPASESVPTEDVLIRWGYGTDTQGPYGPGWHSLFDDFRINRCDLGCEACEDPENPGYQLPDFTPGYLPTFRRQIGDPTTRLDSFICVLESAAMVLDWHTRGAVKVWGGELIPWCGKTEAEILAAPGCNLGDAQRAWLHWSQHLSIKAGQSWDDLMACLTEGRAIILMGDYGEFTLAERCQDDFVDNHAVSVYPYQVSNRLLVGDPICYTFKNFRISSLQAYAEAYGIQIYGVTSPQKIQFAVSRPWTP